MKTTSKRKSRLLIVGAFPDREIGIHGGILTSCRVLLDSSLPDQADLILVDSSSPTVPPPPFLSRLVRACKRIVVATMHMFVSKPDATLLFASPGASFIEKTLVCGVGRLVGSRTMMFPRGAELITQYESSYLYRRILSLCFRVPNLMLCQGLAYQEFFTRRIGMKIEKCPIVHNWTATPSLLDIGSNRNRREQGEGVQILYLGWIAREKGIYELLECVKRLSEQQTLPVFQFVIAGDGSDMAAAQELVESNELSGLVELPGWIDNAAKVQRLREADILVLPSYIEGMPNSIIEAMAAGLPVVATNVGAVPDVVVDEVTGLLVPPRNADELLGALVRLIRDGGLRNQMGHEAHRLANEKFAVEQAVERLLQLAKLTAAPESQ